MRKLFRFKYEPCSGQCYAWCEKLPFELRKLEVSERENLVKTMVEAHEKLCDNPDFSFGVDQDENLKVFVAHYRTPNRTELISGKTFKEVVSTVCAEVMNLDIPKVEGNCIYGDNGVENLGAEILKYCQDEHFHALKHRECVCKQ